MHQIVIGLETPEMRAIEENGDKNQIEKAARDSITQQIMAGRHQLTLDSEDDQPHALIIDGKSLMYALEDELKQKLLELATQCASVICCRVSPKQKALVCLLMQLNAFPVLCSFTSLVDDCLKYPACGASVYFSIECNVGTGT